MTFARRTTLRLILVAVGLASLVRAVKLSRSVYDSERADAIMFAVISVILFSVAFIFKTRKQRK